MVHVIHSRRSMRPIAAAAATVLALAALAAILATGFLGPQVGKIIDDCGQLLASTVAAACCWIAGRRVTGSRRVAWRLLAAYSAVWAISVAIWLAYDVSNGTQAPFTTVAAIGFVASVPFAIAGSLAFGFRHGSRIPLLVRILDAVTVGLALMLICWVPVLEDVFNASSFSLGGEAMSLSIPVGDLLVVTLLWSAVASSAFRMRFSLIAVGLGFIAISGGDLVLADLAARGIFVSGGLLDLLWTGGFLVIAIGAGLEVAPLRLGQAVSAAAVPRRMAIWVPFMCATLAGAIALADFHSSKTIDSVTLYGVVAIMTLAIIRQLIEAVANRGLIEELGHRASTDALTGLANRGQFRQELNRALAGDGSCQAGAAILYIDLDKFKTVNDRFGHAAGDRVLSVIATRLAGTVRPTDNVARLGGDEFAVLVTPPPTRDQLAVLSRRVQECFQEPVSFGTDRITLSATVGAASAHVGDDADALLRFADIALYSAKAHGRGGLEIYDEAVHGDALSRMWLESDMPESLAAGQFTVLYQPTIRSASGTISGAEALVRWDHPTRGRISPLDFIPVAEASGFIVELGSWILHRALEDAASWRRPGLSPSISVNVTAQQLRSGGFVDDVMSALHATHTAPQDLIIELTESAYVQELAIIGSVIRDLRGHGIRIAIDDFGTGYSSLALLTKLDADILKIDRSFVLNATNPAGRLVLKTVLDLARTLRLSSTVEGVETKEEATLVRALGADTIQGYYYDRPLEAPVFRRRIDPIEGSVSITPSSPGSSTRPAPVAIQSGTVTRTVVPRPRSKSTSSVPPMASARSARLPIPRPVDVASRSNPRPSSSTSMTAEAPSRRTETRQVVAAA